MSNYRRNLTPGGTFFFTVVTAKRRPLFGSSSARRALRRAIVSVRQRFPFDTIAIVLLPDHLHAIWTLPVGDSNYSIRWARIKGAVTQDLAIGALRRQSRRERDVWQSRFWEHTCRDEDDV